MTLAACADRYRSTVSKRAVTVRAITPDRHAICFARHIYSGRLVPKSLRLHLKGST
jgi:hypothetical protein